MPPTVKTDPFTPDDTILMEWAVKFTPTDMENITPAQAKLKSNPKVMNVWVLLSEDVLNGRPHFRLFWMSKLAKAPR